MSNAMKEDQHAYAVCDLMVLVRGIQPMDQES